MGVAHFNRRLPPPLIQIKVLQLLQSHFDPKTNQLPEEAFVALASSSEIKAFNKGKGPQQFAAAMREAATAHGASALALTMPFDEADILERNMPYLLSTVSSIGEGAPHSIFHPSPPVSLYPHHAL
jgi:hypothetical protein